MTRVIAVIGAMYGDEGKGLMVDYFAHQYDKAIVVRSNGGSQAGHTVTTPKGERHVFSHFGSGSFAGAATYLSEFFVCNPNLFVKEQKELHDIDVYPTLVIHPNALISTPFDMIINQIVEYRRGNDRHGSCGVGFGETIARSIAHKKLTMRDLIVLTREGLRSRLVDIRNDYVDSKFSDNPLDMDDETELAWFNVLHNDQLIEDWMDDVATMVASVSVADYDIITHDTIIFEGAQGLMLDQQSPDFPHVTRSNTGVTNVMSILKKLHAKSSDFDLLDFEVVYVSRAYTTRHGAGPLDFECELSYDIIDQTNKPNDHQGTLRFAPLLLDTLSSVTLHDFNQLSASDNCSQNTDDLIFNAHVSVAFTCLDQIGPEGLFVAGQTQMNMPHDDFVGLLTESSKYISYGPTRDDITET